MVYLHKVTRPLIFTIICCSFIGCSDTVSGRVDKAHLKIKDPSSTYGLTGNWKYKIGDAPEYARTDFDDNQWPTTEVPGTLSDFEAPGFYWLRLHIHIPNKADKPLFLSLARFYQAYEVYFNGEKLGGRGTLPKGSTEFQWGVGGFHTVLPVALIKEHNVLALRGFAETSLDAGGKYTYSFLGPYQSGSVKFWSLHIANAIISMIALFSGFYYFIGYRDKSIKAQFYINLAGIATGLAFFVVWMPDMLTTPHTAWLHLIGVSLFLVTLALIVQFSNEYFSRLLKPIQFARQPAIYFLIAMALLVLISQSYVIASLGLKLTVGFFILSIPITMIFLFVEGWRSWESNLITGSALFALICTAIDGLSEANLIRLPLPDFIVALSPYGILTVILSFSWIRGRYLLEKEARLRRAGQRPTRRTEVKKYERNLLSGVDLEDLDKRLQTLMEESKVYQTEDISLHQLANELGISGHQLSQFLNERLEMNFNAFINQYRVRDAQKILLADPEASILSIAYHVGFNSKSSFNRAFLKFTGTTPQKYRTDPSEAV